MKPLRSILTVIIGAPIVLLIACYIIILQPFMISYALLWSTRTGFKLQYKTLAIELFPRIVIAKK